MKIERDYEELLRLFNKNKVKYCIVGAFAVAFHALPRYTKDMDILVEPEIENARRIVKSLEEFGFKNLGLTEKDFIHKGSIIQLGYEPVRVDILTTLKGVNLPEVWKGKKSFLYGKEMVFFVGLKELIRNKKAVNRKQDTADLEILRKVIKEE